MSDVWHVINDDKLGLVDRAVEFLMGEFCPPDADPIWSTAYFRWKLGAANPAGAGYLTLAVAGGKVVGTVSLTRKRLLVGGKECQGGEVGDSYSSASMRRGGQPAELSPGDNDRNSYINKSIFGRLASMTRHRAEADGVSLIYGTPNRNAYSGWTKRLNYFDLERCRVAAFVRPTPRLVIAIHPKISALGGVLRSLDVVSTGLLKWAYVRTARRGQTIDRGIPAVAELDELWGRTRSTDSFSLVRDGAYWIHRYREHPLAKYEMFSIRESGRLCGVVATRTFTAGKDRRQLAVVEWMNEESVSFGWVLAEIVSQHKDSSIDFYHLYASEGTKEAGAVTRNLFLRRPRVPVVLAGTPEALRLKLDNCKVEIYLGSTDAV
jgi:hypothetical protein